MATANGYAEFATPDGRRLALLVAYNVVAVVESTRDPRVSLVYMFNGSTSIQAVQGSVGDTVATIEAAGGEGSFLAVPETLTDGRAAVFNILHPQAVQEVDADSCAVLFYSPAQNTIFVSGSYATIAADLAITGGG